MLPTSRMHLPRTQHIHSYSYHHLGNGLSSDQTSCATNQPILMKSNSLSVPMPRTRTHHLLHSTDTNLDPIRPFPNLEPK
uniref:Uncharacterized protein n=1 Tax=Arundo donax TaxID=35708 RepID=A0A0A8ZPM9_ARUDO